MQEPGGVNIDSRKLLSGVTLLLSNSIIQLLGSNDSMTYSSYIWKGMVVDLIEGTLYKPRKCDVFTYPKLPSELDKDMFLIHSLYKQRCKAYTPIRTCTNLSFNLYILNDDLPKLIQNYYISIDYNYNKPLPDERNTAKFKMNMELIEKELNWLHEQNVIMQTL